MTSGELLIESNITINGLGVNSLTISGNGTSRVFNITPNSLVNISNLTVTGGKVANNGAGIFNAGALNLTNVQISGNELVLPFSSSIGQGGGIYNSGTLNLIGSIINGNSAKFLSQINFDYGFVFGIGIYNSNTGKVTVTDSFINFNSNSVMNLTRFFRSKGGGIYSDGELTVLNTQISNNFAGVGEGLGGGIYSNGSLNISNSTISNNKTQATGFGSASGAGLYSTGTATIVNSTISNNAGGGGEQSSFGGGIANRGSSLTIISSTIAFNSIGNGLSEVGGGISGNATLKNTIISNNRLYSSALDKPQDVSGTFNSQGNNLIGNSTGSTGWNNSDLLDLPSQLAALANNGGLTQTHALLSNSPAINAGNNSNTPATDQRGLPRIIAGTIDIGAYEEQQVTCFYTFSPANLSVPASIGTGAFTVTASDSGCTWTPTSNVPWITITNASTITGNGTVNFSFQSNSGPARNGTISVGNQSFIISQVNGCTFSISPNNASFPASGGNGNFNVLTAAGCSWSAASNSPEVTFTNASGTGNGTVSFSVAANSGPARTGTISVGDQIFTFNQASGCTFSISPTSANIGGVGGNFSFNINTAVGCAWTAASNVSWITITSSTNSTGSGTLSYTVQANPSSARQGSIVAAGQTFTVNQVASGPKVVTNLNDSGAGSLRQAVIDANVTLGDDAILFQQGLNGVIALTSGELLVTGNVIITGPDSNLLTVQRNSTSPGFRIFNIQLDSNVSISGLTIADGRAEATSGGSFNNRGGGILNQGKLTLSNSIVKGNVMTGGFGAGIYNEGILSVTNSTITENRLDQSNASFGGGIYNKGTLSLTNSTVSSNSITAVQAGYGGGIASDNGTVNINNCFIIGNAAIGSTNGSDRGSVSGGGIGGTNLVISNSTISGNSARYINTVNSVSGNASGGGIAGNGTFTNTIINNNTTSCVRSCGSGGGGISGSFTIINSVISNNSASVQFAPLFPGIGSGPSGGGFSGSGTFINSTISGNSVSGLDSVGGGISSGNDSKFNNSTITNNSASGTNNRGGGVYGPGTFSNTIISNNIATTGPDINGVITSQGYNLIGNTIGNSGWISTDLLNKDAKLSPLGDNGGSTQTHALLPNSPAINAGNNTNAPSTDQRGLPRIVGGTIDIGSYEEQQLINCTYTLSSSATNITANGGSGSVNVSTTTACSWTAVSNDSWITINSGNNGTGTGTLNFSVQANIGPARTGTITIGGQTFTVNQESGCSFSLPTITITSSSNGDAGSFNILSGTGCTWTATSNASWIIITAGTNGSGNGTVFFQVAANNGPARTGTITVGNQTFTVNQSPGNCSFTLSPTSVNVGAAGGSAGFNISTAAGCAWAAVSNTTWITITSGSSSGAGIVSYSIQANNTGIARQGTITAGGQTFTINQSGTCSYTLTPSSVLFGADGGSNSFQINTSSDCAWNATSTDSWITITTGSGTGNGTINFSVQANTTLQARTGTILVGGQIFTVNQSAAVLKTRFDFDGDGKADVSVYRPSLGGWYISKSSNNEFSGVQWGLPSDVITPADFDGDGKTDVAVFRNGFWYWLNSSNNSFSAVKFGQTGDIPIPADYDNDGKADVAVYRENVPGAGNRSYFYILQSTDNSFRPEQFGAAGDRPVSADFDKDGKADLAVYRDGSLAGGQSYFFYRPTSQPITDFNTIAWGITGDKPAPADFDGDGKQDAAVFRPSTGDWYILNSSDNQFTAMHFGITEDIPVAADYDGDGKADVAVFRPSVGTWYLQRSTAGFTGMQFGVSTDKPIPALGN